MPLPCSSMTVIALNAEEQTCDPEYQVRPIATHTHTHTPLSLRSPTPRCHYKTTPRQTPSSLTWPLGLGFLLRLLRTARPLDLATTATTPRSTSFSPSSQSRLMGRRPD